MTQKEIFEHFVAAINAHDVTAIGNLISPDHIFIDASGNEKRGADTSKATWQNYFNAIAEYKIVVSEVFTDGNAIAAFGTTGGRIAEDKWIIPSSWRAEVRNGKIVKCQVYADTKLQYDVMTRNSFSINDLPRATAIGGVFFKCTDAEKTRAWYKEHLGLNTDKYGTTFEWRQASDPEQMGYTQWSPFKSTTTYFEPSSKEFMINYRVVHIEALVEKLQKAGVVVTDKIETFEYGKFVHVMDCDGNKIELWEPNDGEYGKILEVKTK